MGQHTTYSFPAKGLLPASQHGMSSLELNQDSLHVGDMVIGNEGGERKMSEWMAEMEAKVDAILEAISLNHQKGPDGKCVPDCWSCKVMETIEGIKVSNRLRGK